MQPFLECQKVKSNRVLIGIVVRVRFLGRQRLATAAVFLRSYVAWALSRADEPRHSLHASAWLPDWTILSPNSRNLDFFQLVWTKKKIIRTFGLI